MKARLFVLLISGSLFAACVFVAIPIAFTDTSGWKETEGTVVQARTSGTGQKRKLHLQYEYRVNQRTYQGRRGTLWSDPIPGYARRGEDQAWTPGSRIKVFHHPSDPAQAVLDPTISPLHKVLCVAGAAVSVLGMLGGAFGRIQQR